jgi:predicted esterase
MPDPRLQRAIELVTSGKVEEARQLLEILIKERRGDMSAWKWYAETWPSPKDKIHVWELCLRYNPMDRQALESLSVLAPDRYRELLSQPGNDRSPKARPSGRRSFWVLSAILGGLILLLVLIAIPGIFVPRFSAKEDPAAYKHSQPVEYYLYAPRSYAPERQWPLFVGIHGAGGNGLDCWNLWQPYADREGFILLCPSIPGDAGGFYQDVGERTVWSAVAQVRKAYHVSPRMFFSGFSGGAFFIQGFAYHYPESVTGLSILSSGNYLDPRIFSRLGPVAVVIGGADDPLAVYSSRKFVEDLSQLGFDVKYKVVPFVGHAVSRTGINMTLELFRKLANR